MDFLTFDSLPPELCGAIAPRSLTSEQILFRQGDLAAAFYIVETGRLKIVRRTPEGRSATLQIAKAGDGFGESALFSELYSYTAIADVPSHVIAYPKHPLRAALRRSPELAEALMSLLVKKHESFIRQLELRDIRAAHVRVLQYLRYLAEPSDAKPFASHSNRTVVQFDRPLKEIAIDLGLTPATLSRALTRLEQEGVISRQHSSVTLHKFSAA